MAVPVGFALPVPFAARGLVMPVGVAIAMIQSRAASALIGNELAVLAGECADALSDTVLARLQCSLARRYLRCHLPAPVGWVGAARDRGLCDCGRRDHSKRCHSETRCGLDDKRGYTAAQ